ncbi:MAG: aromatic ring-hydroxylating oxygenase subunit alpha [Isosphaeraceae bacterium]
MSVHEKPRGALPPEALSLSARYYTDPETFRSELERFFFGNWIHAGRAEELARPGDYVLRSVGGESVIITRDDADICRAFYNVCRHRGTRLCEADHGHLAGKLTGPYHAWSYDLSGRLVAAPQMDDGKRHRSCLPGLPDEECHRVYYYALLPNLLLSLHPDHMMTHTLWPRAVDRTEIVCEWHFHPDALGEPGLSSDGAVAFWDMTNRQDWHVCEQMQLGVGSRAYRPGPYSNREDLLYGFDCLIRSKEGATAGTSGSRGSREGPSSPSPAGST